MIGILAIFILIIGIFYFTQNNKTQLKNVNLPQVPNISEESTLITIEPEKLNKYQVPILMYHYIRNFDDPNDEIGTKLSVSPEKFDEQLGWLKKNDYQTVSPDYLLNPVKLDNKPIILTFDDGYKDAYTNALPILRKYGFIATFYIITTYINNNDNYMTWNEIIELKNAGMNIGSHTLTHPSLDKSYDERVDKEVEESKKIIEEKIGIPILDFCYPSGKYDKRTINKLKEAGYKTAVTVHNGITDQNSDLFELPRIRMNNDTNLELTLQ